MAGEDRGAGDGHGTEPVDDAAGHVHGDHAGEQATRARQLIAAAGQRVEVQSFPTMGHSMHGQDPQLFSTILVEWASTLS